MTGRTNGMLRVIFAGGGTGGHLYPAVAMHEQLALRADGVDALFIGARGGMEETLLDGMGVRYELLPGRGLRGASIIRKLTTPFVFVDAVRRAVSVTRRFRPDVVVGTGGYASAAAVVAAIILGVPRVLQEQNSIPGLVNRRLGRFANLVLASFESSKKYFPAHVRCDAIGNPFRRFDAKTRVDAATQLGLDPQLETILIIGGSRGAHSLNVAGAASIAAVRKSRDIQAVILTGINDFEAARKQFEGDERRVKVLSYLDDPGAAYTVADIAVARAGASVVFELAAFGVPTVFVPYPWAADNHQAENAAELVKQGGAVVIRDDRLTGDALTKQLVALLDDTSRRAEMSDAMKGWAKPDAARVAAETISEFVKKKGDARHAVALGF